MMYMYMYRLYIYMYVCMCMCIYDTVHVQCCFSPHSLVQWLKHSGKRYASYLYIHQCMSLQYTFAMYMHKEDVQWCLNGAD